MGTASAKQLFGQRDTDLVRQVNQLFHELTQRSFDDEHRYRHRAERGFWKSVGELIRARAESPATVSPGLTVVDLACGTGFVTQTLGAYLGPQDVLIAIDVSPAALETTGRKWANTSADRSSGPSLCRLAADGQALALPTGSADVVAINAALHHLPDAMAAMRQIDRILKPGGIFALGFEPNRTHFASPAMSGLSRVVDRAAWYMSPRQNLRRLRTRLGIQPADLETDLAGSYEELTAEINSRLISDRAINSPLTTDTLLDLVDPHARGASEVAGFDPDLLLGEALVGYKVLKLVSSDYLGESGRRFATVRCLADAIIGSFLPRHGSLFSWVVQKPVTGRTQEH